MAGEGVVGWDTKICNSDCRTQFLKQCWWLVNQPSSTVAHAIVSLIGL